MTRRRIVDAAATLALCRRTTRRHFLLNPDEARQMERELAVRIGRKKACCAIARRLAALLWAMWKNETEFDPRLPA